MDIVLDDCSLNDSHALHVILSLNATPDITACLNAQ